MKDEGGLEHPELAYCIKPLLVADVLTSMFALSFTSAATLRQIVTIITVKNSKDGNFDFLCTLNTETEAVFENELSCLSVTLA